MKKFIFGLILGVGLTFSVSAYAEVENYVGKLIEGQFNVKLDGVQLEEPALVVDGTSYLPVRAIADAMGLEANFNADLGIELKKKPGQTTQDVQRESNRRDRGPTKEEIEYRLKKIEEHIEGNENIKEEIFNKVPGLREKAEQEIIDLKSEKAELEAQLKQLEEAP